MKLGSEPYLNKNEYRASILLFFFFLYLEDVCLHRYIATDGNCSTSEMFLKFLMCLNSLRKEQL